MKTNAGGDRVLKGHDKLKCGLVWITKPVTHSLIAFFPSNYTRTKKFAIE